MTLSLEERLVQQETITGVALLLQDEEQIAQVYPSYSRTENLSTNGTQHNITAAQSAADDLRWQTGIK